MLEGPIYYYFKNEDEIDLIDIIVRVGMENIENGHIIEILIYLKDIGGNVLWNI